MEQDEQYKRLKEKIRKHEKLLKNATTAEEKKALENKRFKYQKKLLQAVKTMLDEDIHKTTEDLEESSTSIHSPRVSTKGRISALSPRVPSAITPESILSSSMAKLYLKDSDSDDDEKGKSSSEDEQETKKPKGQRFSGPETPKRNSSKEVLSPSFARALLSPQAFQNEKKEKQAPLLEEGTPKTMRGRISIQRTPKTAPTRVSNCGRDVLSPLVAKTLVSAEFLDSSSSSDDRE